MNEVVENVAVMEKVKISDICNISNGYAFKSDKYVADEGARVIRITNVQKGKIEDNDPKLYPFFELDKLDNYKIFEGDILMSLTGNVGRVGKYPKELLPAYINQRVCRVMPKNGKLETNYLFHFLNSNKFENDAIRNSAGAAQLNLSTKWLGEYEIPLPPLATQQKIATILDKADELRQYNNQLIEKYDALTQSLFLEMFGDPVRNEKGWEITTFSKILSKIESGWSPVCENKPRTSDKEWAVLKLGAVSYSIYNSKENKKCEFEVPISKLDCEVKKGDLLFTRKNTYHMVGTTAFVYETESKLLLPDTVFRLVYIKEKSNPLFLYYLLNHNKFSAEIQSLASGTSGSMPNISKAKLLAKETILPPIDLQNQFAERVQLIEVQKQQAQEALAKSEELFQSLLQKAFKGELV